MLHFLVLIASLIVGMNSLCSWNRHDVPATDSELASTMNYINGQWVRDTSQSSGSLLNGQQYWKKTQQTGCYVPTLWLYYYKGQNDGDYQWLISATWGSTPSSAYVICNKDPNPTNPVSCNGHWKFAPSGVPSSDSSSYVIDDDFYFKENDCPQVLCETVQFATTAGEDFAGDFNRESTNDQLNHNTYIQTNSQSSSNKFYLYFNHEVFKWIVNEDYESDCQKATAGQVTAVSTIKSWSTTSAIDTGKWFFVVQGSSETRYITCSGQIPTTAPSKSDATGEPTPAPTDKDYNCETFGTHPACQPTSPTTLTPTKTPTAPTVNYPTIPTIDAPRTPSPEAIKDDDDALMVNYKMAWIAFGIALYQLLL